MEPLAALAEIARRAVIPVELGRALQDAVELAAGALEAPHATVLELSPDGDDMRLRAGVGWEEDAIGHPVDPMPEGYIAFTLNSAEPVVVDDIVAERRFAASPVLEDLGIRTSAAVRIPGTGDRPFGVVGMHRTEPRPFTAADVALLAGTATILTSVIARHRRAIDINDAVLQSLVVARYGFQQGRPDALAMLDDAIVRTRALVSAMLGENAGAALPGDLRRRDPVVTPEP